ncbi:Zn(2)-C6 fungal-type DNA-binding domain protein [Akanthomyces lecanii RCEF 1005]|uniref:Zn(2)-C6 fungal-type DNA-binding domain protein n=1 Tax=Akanthomyces lecanii RCEF 1005 TaxID=1081108 RepID=A0A168FBN4_CORDF|nr:Zn(2)-C6 fungal-type DNA-binding domain protein [Akanthomyces lecanii RCEF 1005]
MSEPGSRSSAGDGDQRRIWSCVTCRRRKVKCDRRAPRCDVCTKTGIECHYPVGGRLPSRARAQPQWSSPHQKQTDLMERLRRLEAVVTELSAQVDEANDAGTRPEGHGWQLTPNSRAVSSTEMVDADQEPEEDFGQLVTGGDGRVRIAKSFWSVFCDEVDHIFESIQDASEQSQEDFISQSSSSLCYCQSFGLGGDASMLPQRYMGASSTQTSLLLQTYKERLDPFVKVLSTDALQHLCDSWSTSQSELEPAQASLRSAAMFGAAITLTAAETKAAFETTKDALLTDLRALAERELARSKYMSATDLVVLQALLIYTSMLPYANMHDVAGPLAASTVQVAMQNGLHMEKARESRDNANVREMMWLQVCFLSSRFQVADVAVSEWPLNVAAVMTCCERLYSDSPEQRMLLFTRQTVWHLSRQMRHLSSGVESGEAETLVSAAKLAVEEQHERHLLTCKTPFAAFIQKMSQLFFAKIQHALIAQKWQQHDSGQLFAPGPQTEPIAQALSDASMTTLETMHALGTQPDWAPWRWQLQGLFPWAAMKLVFAHFGACRWTPLSERAWVLARAVVGSASDEVRRDPAWAALGKLMEAAEGQREREMQRLMGDAMAGGDYMRIIEAGQRVFYGEGLGGGVERQEEQIPLAKRDGEDVWEVNEAIGEPGSTYNWPDELAAMDAVSW